MSYHEDTENTVKELKSKFENNYDKLISYNLPEQIRIQLGYALLERVLNLLLRLLIDSHA